MRRALTGSFPEILAEPQARAAVPEPRLRQLEAERQRVPATGAANGKQSVPVTEFRVSLHAQLRTMS